MDIPYIFLVPILLLLSYIEHKNSSSKCYRFAELLVVLFIGLRDSTVGADTLNYVRYFTGVQNFYNYDSRDLEVFFPMYNKLFGIIFFQNGTLYLLFNAIVTLSPIFYLVNHYSKNKCLSITLLFIGMFYTVYFVALRQMLGLTLLLWGVIAVLNNSKYKWIIYVILTYVGFCFHESVILFSLSYLLAFFVDLNGDFI